MLRSSLVLLAAALLGGAPALAQQKRVSPHETISAPIEGNRVMIVYGRPYSKDPKSGETRKIWGALVPYGKVWRLGSDEATLLVTQKPIVLGGVAVPAGAYTLWLLPAEDGSAKLIINRQIGQWGLDRKLSNIYDEANDVGRADLAKADLDAPVDEFTMNLSKNPGGGGLLKLSWEKTQYSVTYTVAK